MPDVPVVSPLVFLMARGNRARAKHRALTAALIRTEETRLRLLRDSLTLRADLLRQQNHPITGERFQKLSSHVALYFARDGRLLRREERFLQRINEAAHG
jgi:hypothetical protein